jgi:uncharacterized protein YeaO (DUF488 family)
LIIKVERIYAYPTENNNDSFRIRVDRLWPRGLRKEEVKVDLWLKDIAPSALLRKWFSHDENKWNEFKTKYFKELEKDNEYVNMILGKASGDSITLLYGSKNEKFNNAIALKEYLEQKIKKMQKS